MIFNGHTENYIDSLDEDLFNDIQVMYADGMLGNKAIFDAIAPLTAGIFNYIRTPTSKAFSASEIFPHITEYMVNPDFQPSAQEVASNGLLAFISQASGFNIGRFKNGANV